MSVACEADVFSLKRREISQVKWYVAAKEGGNILVAPSSEHSSLYTTSILAGPAHWIAGATLCHFLHAGSK